MKISTPYLFFFLFLLPANFAEANETIRSAFIDRLLQDCRKGEGNIYCSCRAGVVHDYMTDEQKGNTASMLNIMDGYSDLSDSEKFKVANDALDPDDRFRDEFQDIKGERDKVILEKCGKKNPEHWIRLSSGNKFNFSKPLLNVVRPHSIPYETIEFGNNEYTLIVNEVAWVLSNYKEYIYVWKFHRNREGDGAEIMEDICEHVEVTMKESCEVESH